MGKSSRKVAPRFYCPDCDYATSKKSNWTKHLGTTKHQNGNNGNKKVAKKNDFSCVVCGRQYKYRSGLSRHKKSCNGNVAIEPSVLRTVKKLIEENEKEIN